MENNYWIVYGWLIFKPDFNDETIIYYDVINKYKKIMFSDYNNPLMAIESNNQFKDKYYGNYIKSNFNQKIDLSNNINLTHLNFGKEFNKKIDLTKYINLTHLTFGWKFDQEIFIPLNIKSLNMICCNNQYIIDNLHNNIEELTIYKTNLNLDNLPNSIKILYINNYEKELNNLPNSIEYLELSNYELKIKKIPKNLKRVKCDKEYQYINDFKNYEVINYY